MTVGHRRQRQARQLTHATHGHLCQAAGQGRAGFAWRVGRKAIINRLPEQPGDVPLTFADITKSREKLGYRPTTKISQGIPKFVEWYLKTYVK